MYLYLPVKLSSRSFNVLPQIRLNEGLIQRGRDVEGTLICCAIVHENTYLFVIPVSLKQIAS